MATGEVGSTLGHNSPFQIAASRPGEALADRVLTGATMCGAVLGAVAGAVVGAGAEGVIPIIAGTFGVLVGSGVTAVVGQYALLPLWTAFFERGAPRA
jgi:hypothetical protein